MPFSEVYDVDGEILLDIESAGIGVVVPLASREECLRKSDRDLHGLYDTRGLTVVPFAIGDFDAPGEDELPAFDATVARVHQLGSEGLNILIHCSAGIGRTGTFAACLAVRVLELDGDAAIAWARKHIDGAVERASQEEFVRRFAMRLRA